MHRLLRTYFLPSYAKTYSLLLSLEENFLSFWIFCKQFFLYFNGTYFPMEALDSHFSSKLVDINTFSLLWVSLTKVSFKLKSKFYVCVATDIIFYNVRFVMSSEIYVRHIQLQESKHFNWMCLCTLNKVAFETEI